MTTILWGYTIPQPSLPQPFDTERRPADCEECGEEMEWNDSICSDVNCDCQGYAPRVHTATGYADCESERRESNPKY